VQVAEVQISDVDFGDQLKDMRVWLDANCFAPSTYTYFFLLPGMRVRISFDSDNEAIAFAAKFGGTVLNVADAGGAGARRRGDA
jgi:hypothetical protein